MLKTTFKPVEELQMSLKKVDRIAVFSCNFCANLNGTGGENGLKLMKRYLKEWGKTVVLAKTVNVCCSETIMMQTVRIYLQPILSNCEALVMLSCAGGVKTAFLCNSGIPIIAALDSFGSVSISRQDDPVVKSVCVGCGECVLTYTGGICPISECPAKNKYGPCNKTPTEGEQCSVLPSRKCIWKEISKRGNISALKELGHRRKLERPEMIEMSTNKETSALMRGLAGWTMARAPSLSKIVRWIR